MYIKDKALIQEIANHYNEVSKNVWTEYFIRKDGRRQIK
jgi:hypothetical protein